MKRDAYLSDRSVAAFVEWGGHLVRGEWRLEHSWRGKGPAFQCATLYQAFERYRWPNSVSGDNANDTIARFARFRQDLDAIGNIETYAQRDRFISIAGAIAEWGGIKNLKRLTEWGQMEPRQLQNQIADAKRKLDPGTAELASFRYMGSAFSKIYSALIPGLPIYDSRVACALACLVNLYCRDTGRSQVPPLLNLGIPQGRGNAGGRCSSPTIYASQETKYARDNLQFAWLMQGMAADPGDFAPVPAGQRVDALQSALFMLGYARLRDDAVVKMR